MTGLKTILALVVSAFIVPLFAKHAVQLSPEDQVTFVTVGMAGIGIAFRFVSNGPALAGVLAWFHKSNTPDISALADAVIAEIKRRQAAAKAAQVPAPVTTQGKV